MARTSNPTLLLVVLAGLSVGLWLAAHTGGGAAQSQGLAPEDASTASSSDERPRATLVEPERATSARARPRRAALDAPLVPKPGETCLSGTFEAADGSVPAHVGVALFTLEDGHPVFPPFATFAAGEDGVVRACTKLEQDCDVVLFAPGFEPAKQHVVATAGGIELAPFVLEVGATVTGRVTARDVPLPRAEIEARAIAPGYEARVDSGLLGWRAGRFVWASTRAETGNDGTYAIRGLDPGRHELRLCTVRQRDVAIDVQKVATQRSDVPAAGVDFALPAGKLDLSFESSGAPLCCVEVQIQAGDRLFMRRTDDVGRLGFLIQPELAYEITAARFGFETIHTQLRGLTDGEHRPEKLALEPQSELATIAVQDYKSAGPLPVTFELRPRFPVDDARVIVRSDVTRDPTTNKLLIPNVAAGSWRLTMRSGLPLKPGARISSLCETDQVVQVPDHGTLDIQMSLYDRGGVSLETHSTDGTPLDPTVQLFDERNEPIDDVTVLNHLPISREAIERMTSVKEVESAGSNAPPPLAGHVFVYSSWCAGTVKMQVSAPGMETVTKSVAIVFGELKQVSVVLHPK